MTLLSPKALDAKAFITDQVKNKIFVIHFIKANGELRRLRGQYGVHVGVKGTGHEMPPHLIKVYDHDEKNLNKKFKSVNLETIQSIDCGQLHWDNAAS
jgi:hypothetical protein